MQIKQEIHDLQKQEVFRKETLKNLRIVASSKHVQMLPRRQKTRNLMLRPDQSPKEKLMTPSISATIYKKKLPSPTRPRYQQLKVPLHPQVPKLQLPPGNRLYAKMPPSIPHTLRVQDGNENSSRINQMSLRGSHQGHQSSKQSILSRAPQLSPTRYVRQKRTIVNNLSSSLAHSPSPVRVISSREETQAQLRKTLEDLAKVQKIDLMDRQEYRSSSRRGAAKRPLPDLLKKQESQEESKNRVQEVMPSTSSYPNPVEITEVYGFEEETRFNDWEMLKRSYDTHHIPQVGQNYEDVGSCVASSYSGGDQSSVRMGPLKPKIISHHRKATSVTVPRYQLKIQSLKRTLPMPNTIPIQTSHLKEKLKEEETQKKIKKNEQLSGLLMERMAQHTQLGEESRQNFYNNALNDLKERLSQETGGSTSQEITLIDQLLEIYRALQKRRKSSSLEPEPGMQHSPPMRKSVSKSSKMWPNISPKREFARILNNIENQHPVRIENAQDETMSPDSDLAFQIHINGRQKDASSSRIKTHNKTLSQNVSIPPSSFFQESKIRKATIHPPNIIELTKRPQWNFGEKLPALAVQCLKEVTPRSVFNGGPSFSYQQNYKPRSKSPTNTDSTFQMDHFPQYSSIPGTTENIVNIERTRTRVSDTFLPSITRSQDSDIPTWNPRREIIRIPLSTRLPKPYRIPKRKNRQGQGGGDVSIEPEEWEGSDDDLNEEDTSVFVNYQLNESIKSPDQPSSPTPMEAKGIGQV